MGYMCHHTIVVTGHYDDDGNVTRAKPASFSHDFDIRVAHMKAMEIFKGQLVSPIIKGVANGYGSFFIAPDGSKEGWEPSDDHDDKREQFIKWLDTRRYEDQSSPFKWAELQFGDEGGDQRILRHSNEPPKNPLERIAENLK